jgi:hypothetical protein
VSRAWQGLSESGVPPRHVVSGTVVPGGGELTCSMPFPPLSMCNQHSHCCLQVKSASDSSNFHASLSEDAAGGAYRGKPYASKGDFKDF